MTITQTLLDGHVLVHMEGRFDFAVRNLFKVAIEEAAREQKPLVLDLERVSFVDSSALGLLVITHQSLKIKNIPFWLVNPQAYVRQVLDLANVAKIIPIFQSVHELPDGTAAPSGAPVPSPSNFA